MNLIGLPPYRVTSGPHAGATVVVLSRLGAGLCLVADVVTQTQWLERFDALRLRAAAKMGA